MLNFVVYIFYHTDKQTELYTPGHSSFKLCLTFMESFFLSGESPSLCLGLARQDSSWHTSHSPRGGRRLGEVQEGHGSPKRRVQTEPLVQRKSPSHVWYPPETAARSVKPPTSSLDVIHCTVVMILGNGCSGGTSEWLATGQVWCDATVDSP